MWKARKNCWGSELGSCARAWKCHRSNFLNWVDVDPRYISRIERGNCFPSLDTLENIAQSLCVEMRDGGFVPPEPGGSAPSLRCAGSRDQESSPVITPIRDRARESGFRSACLLSWRQFLSILLKKAYFFNKKTTLAWIFQGRIVVLKRKRPWRWSGALFCEPVGPEYDLVVLRLSNWSFKYLNIRHVFLICFLPYR